MQRGSYEVFDIFIDKAEVAEFKKFTSKFIDCRSIALPGFHFRGHIAHRSLVNTQVERSAFAIPLSV
jgi:hypothetical protein